MEQWGALAALGAAAMWTVNSVIMERRGIGLDSRGLNAGRIFLGLLLITLVHLLRGHGLFPQAVGADAWLWLLLSGVIGFAAGDSLLVSGFLSIGARLTLLVFSFSPVLTAILSYLLFGEILGLFKIIGMLLVIGGIMLVIGGKGEKAQSADMARGLLFAFLAALAQAASNITSKMGLSQVDAIGATQIRLMGGVIGIVVVLAMGGAWDKLRAVLRSPNGRLTILSGACIGTLLGVVLSMTALQLTKAAIASTLMTTMPVLILPISRFILKEQLHAKDILGAAICVAGSAILFL